MAALCSRGIERSQTDVFSALDDAVFRYWPEFKSNGKEDITVRDLLTHYSGLNPTFHWTPGGQDMRQP
ncbi:MAG: class A beta-lactamase-related serine hydrolase [Nitrospirales bacterium]|nr:MAG: class A beta-lactamase-related serine hydrolase [Nitrospirales bacterium]